MKIYRYDDIADCHSKIVQSYLNNGYVLSPRTQLPSTSYGFCQSLIDLIDKKHPDHVLRVFFISNLIKSTKDSYAEVSGVIIRKIQCNDLTCRVYFYGNIIDDDSSVVYKNIFYLINKDNEYLYVDNSDDWDHINKLIDERTKNKYDTEECLKRTLTRTYSRDQLTPNAVDLIMNRVNRIQGFKRATASCIDRIVMKRSMSHISAEVYICYNYKRRYFHFG